MLQTETNWTELNKKSSFERRQSLDPKIVQVGEEIFANLKEDGQSIFNKDWWYGRIMDWSMRNKAFKTQMFRFVDVLPTLQSSSEVAKHLKEYFSEKNGDLPSIFNFGLGIGGLAPSLMAGAIKKNINDMANMFIVGEDGPAALPKLVKGRQKPIGFTVDILGEATLSESEAIEYQKKYLQLLEDLAKASDAWPTISVIDKDHLGDIPKVNVSVKLSSLYSKVKAEAWDESKKMLKDRVRPILESAVKKNIFINVDMESFDLKDLTIETFTDLLLEPQFKNYPHLGIVIQAYLRESFNDVQKLIQFAKSRQTPFSIRLVKGAYWDTETILAQQHGWPIPVFTNKAESDANYEACLWSILENYQHLKLAVGSHNVRSIAAAMVFAKELNVPEKYLEIQMLYGMADPIKNALLNMNQRLREYCPVGELIPGMAYLVRRLLENTSNESFLRSKFSENMDTKLLLQNPQKIIKATSAMSYFDSNKFNNLAPVDFAVKSERDNLTLALNSIKKSLKQSVQPIVNGKTLKSKDVLTVASPNDSKLVVSEIELATIEHAELAIQSANLAAKSWSKVSPEERAKLVFALADEIEKNKFDLMACEIIEVGKPWTEADADIGEAVDFCRFYAREMLRLKDGFPAGAAPGESSRYMYRPKGILAVIAPWNFPLAILTGMVAAGLVTGNGVIIKPAEQSSLIAKKLMQILLKVGFPEKLVHLLPGRGEIIGDYLVKHKDVQVISFTGSKEVGLLILKNAAQVQPGQRAVKKCIIEMGGKNAIIIDNDADLDEAIDGVLKSAFGFAGQKCSACSRVFVMPEIYDRFKERLIESAQSYTVGSAEAPESMLGPVIDNESMDRLRSAVTRGKSSAEVLFEASAPTGGNFFPPTIFEVSDSKNFLLQDEFFGPILAIMKVKDLEDAVEKVNEVEYGLTGGLFSRSPSNIEYVKTHVEVGNFYINRTITGAMVERHPFGGVKMSGIGSKTGGPDYLTEFMDPVVVTENTLRRGFAPEA
jgi:RHH-type proline utilization regulon transcriptional repressor/proline dehydrogenase/delta 1-pyrroline-5-carboxylate dehydrogenase